MSVVTALLVLVRQTVCYIIKGAQSPVGLSWWLEEVAMVSISKYLGWHHSNEILEYALPLPCHGFLHQSVVTCPVSRHTAHCDTALVI